VILVNGQSETQLTVSDRGLQYGDGLFETIAYRNRHLELSKGHFTRLQLGCERLGIPFTDFSLLRDEIDTAVQNVDGDAVIKVIITRGSGGRGYKADSQAQPTRIISVHPIPDYPENRQNGITVIRCQHPVSLNSVLAGIKHLNRLDQVIARNEWDDTDIAEGLMFTEQGELIEGTMSNVFLIKDNQLITPSLAQAGIQGVMRTLIIAICHDIGVHVSETTLTEADFLNAEGAFVCNSLIGIWPITHYVPSNKMWEKHALITRLQTAVMENLAQ
jgi:4-amino-4-deoxychorismate lyase